MGISVSGGDGFDGFADDLLRQVSDDFHEAMAEGVADKAREQGLSSADAVEIDIESDSPEIPVDVERIRRRANDILRG